MLSQQFEAPSTLSVAKLEQVTLKTEFLFVVASHRTW